MTDGFRLDPDELVAAAVTQAGTDDLGPDTYREGLEVYCRSVVEEARLNDLGTAAVPGSVVGALANRARVHDWARRHPEVAEERIEAPFVVVGVFRAGTTLTSYLLEKDERHRPLLGWEAKDSAPPRTPATPDDDPRIEAARAARAMLDQINPRIGVVQSEEPDGPTECISVLDQDLKSLLWEALTNVPSYGTWLHETDHRSAYEYHRLVLQVLQSGGVRGRWSLKSPHHALHLEELTSVYPDARLVALHRDPVVLSASVCSLIDTLTSTFTDADHRPYIAEHWTDMLARSIAGIDDFRAAHPDVPIVDVRYHELVADPVRTMEGVYAGFGDELTDQARSAMEAHVRARPKGHRGVHRYDLAEYGLDAGELAERFADYSQRYGVEPEQVAAT